MPSSLDTGALATLHLAEREVLEVAGGLVTEAAGALGLPSKEGIALRALVERVLGTIVREGFPGEAQLDIDVSVERRPGGMAIVLSDRGVPLSIDPSSQSDVVDLVRLGFADDVTIHSHGRQGQRTEIFKRLTYRAITDDSEFAASATAQVNLELGDDGRPALDIRAMTADDVVGVAQLFFRTYGYSAYYAASVYEPDLLAELVRAGHHLATVAVTPTGRIVGHLATKVARPDDTVGMLGLLAIDPAYRSFGITQQIGFVHVVRLVESGFVGQFSEAVTVHDRSQRIALRSGGHEVGLLLGAQSSALELAGFDVDTSQRHSVMLLFAGLGAIDPRSVHVPQAYEAIAGRIYSECGLTRALQRRSPRPPRRSTVTTRFKVQFSQEGGVARVQVERFGHDFDKALQAQLRVLRLNRYEVIYLFLPLGDPMTSFYGDGLQSMGLSFAGIYPEYDNGDALVLQSLNNVEVDPTTIVTASDFGVEMKDFVVADMDRAAQSNQLYQRSHARLARVLEALE